MASAAPAAFLSKERSLSHATSGVHIWFARPSVHFEFAACAGYTAYCRRDENNWFATVRRNTSNSLHECLEVCVLCDPRYEPTDRPLATRHLATKVLKTTKNEVGAARNIVGKCSCQVDELRHLIRVLEWRKQRADPPESGTRCLHSLVAGRPREGECLLPPCSLPIGSPIAPLISI